MPKIDAKTLRVPVTISGYDFTCPTPYVAGHVLTEGEAEALNTLFVDRIKTNCVRSIRDLSDNSGLDTDDRWYNMQKAINSYADAYDFSSRADPIRRKALALAMESIRAMAERDNISLTPEAIRIKAEAAIASGRYPQLTEAARNYVEAQRAFANEELER